VAAHEWLQMKVPNLYHDGIFKLLPRCGKYVFELENYTEK